MKPHDHDVRKMLASHRAPAPDPEMIRRLKGDLRQEMALLEERTVLARRSIIRRLTLGGIACFPVILGLDLLLWTALEAVFGLVLPHGALTVLMVTFLFWAALALTVSYGSLPFLGYWAVRMSKGEHHGF